MFSVRTLGNNRKFMLFIIVVLVVGIYAIYLNKYNPVIQNLFAVVLKEQMVQSSLTIEFDSSTNHDIGIYKDSVVLCSKDGVRAVNKKGEEEWTVSLTLSKPFLEISHKYILVADKGGREVHVITNSSVLCTIRTDTPIISANINSAGYLAVITEEKGYKGKITVYDVNSQGQEIYKWYSGQNYITDVAISKDNKHMVVSTIDTSKGRVSGGLVFFNFSQDKPYAGVVKEDTLITNLKFFKDNMLVALGDNQVLGFSLEGEEQWSHNYEGKLLQTFHLNEEGMIGLALKEDSNRSLVRILNYKGEVKGTKEVNGVVKYIHVGDKFIAINNKRNISLITHRGEDVAEAAANRDVQNILLFENNKEILVVSRNCADILELK